MEYTVDRLARLAGVSPRTIRYYDQIGLLTPTRISSSGYRIYGKAQVDRLQQILFYRELGMELSRIAQTLDGEEFDRLTALRSHLEALEARKEQTDRLILALEKTIQHEMGMTEMTDKEKFEGFKEQLIEENEKAYGAEIREKYGDDTIDASNAKMMGLTREQYAEMEKISRELHGLLEKAVREGISPSSEAGKEIAELHKAWLGFTWPQYSPEAHKGLGDMYVADERFTAYYDKNLPGCAAFMRDAIHHWVK